MADEEKTKRQQQQEQKEKHKAPAQQEKDLNEDVTSQTPARPTNAEAQLDNMQDVDMNTVQKKAGTYDEVKKNKEDKEDKK